MVIWHDFILKNRLNLQNLMSFNFFLAKSAKKCRVWKFLNLNFRFRYTLRRLGKASLTTAFWRAIQIVYYIKSLKSRLLWKKNFIKIGTILQHRFVNYKLLSDFQKLIPQKTRFANWTWTSFEKVILKRHLAIASLN